MVTPLGWLERVPTYKEALDNVQDKDLHTYGFLGYPVLQSADIVIYDADLVPVGEDQVAHIELSREDCKAFRFLLRISDIKPELFTSAGGEYGQISLLAMTKPLTMQNFCCPTGTLLRTSKRGN